MGLGVTLAGLRGAYWIPLQSSFVHPVSYLLPSLLLCCSLQAAPVRGGVRHAGGGAAQPAAQPHRAASSCLSACSWGQRPV